MTIVEIKDLFDSNRPSWTTEVKLDTLVITNEHDISAILVKTDSQILVESPIYPVSAVKNEAELDSKFMFAHKELPLTSVGKTDIQGEVFYTAFGSLSATSTPENIELEVAMLFQNVEQIIELSVDLLNIQDK